VYTWHFLTHFIAKFLCVHYLLIVQKKLFLLAILCGACFRCVWAWRGPQIVGISHLDWILNFIFIFMLAVPWLFLALQVFPPFSLASVGVSARASVCVLHLQRRCTFFRHLKKVIIYKLFFKQKIRSLTILANSKMLINSIGKRQKHLEI